AAPPAFRPMVASEMTRIGLKDKLIQYGKDIFDNLEELWEDVPQNFEPRRTLHIIWQITERCNGNCMHCRVEVDEVAKMRRGGKDGMLTIEEGMQAVTRTTGSHCGTIASQFRPDPSLDTLKRWLMNILESWDSPERKKLFPNRDQLVLVITGGEPLIRKDLWEFLDFAHEKIKGTKHLLALATNGLLVTPEVAKRFAAYAPHISHVFVSIDSVNPDTNDKIRGIKGALEKQIEAIKMFTGAGVMTIMSTVVQKLNFEDRSWQDLSNIQDEINKENQSNPNAAMAYFYPGFIIRSGRAHDRWDRVGLTPEQYKEFFLERNEAVTEKMNNGGEIPFMDAFDITPWMWICNTPEHADVADALGGCQACRCVMGIAVDGWVYPCEFESKTKLGHLDGGTTFFNAYNAPIARVIRERKFRTKEPCKSCHHLPLCGGGCILFQETLDNDILSAWPYCWHDPNEAH
ncbi:MAG: radical SAM protein, partial [Candidatus Hodarchaeota archaeon]